MNWIDEAMSPFKGGGASSSTDGAEPPKRRGSHFGGFSIKESIKRFGAHEDELDKDLNDMKRRSEQLAKEEDEDGEDNQHNVYARDGGRQRAKAGDVMLKMQGPAGPAPQNSC